MRWNTYLELKASFTVKQHEDVTLRLTDIASVVKKYFVGNATVCTDPEDRMYPVPLDQLPALKDRGCITMLDHDKAHVLVRSITCSTVVDLPQDTPVNLAEIEECVKNLEELIGRPFQSTRLISTLGPVQSEEGDTEI